MIFMNCVVRSSRVTGPKMRVPIGSSLFVKQHGGVAVEADQRAVGAAQAVPRAHDDGVVHLALLDAAARDRVLDRDLDDVADVRIAALRAAEYPDAHQAARAAVVGGIQHGLCLDHGGPLTPRSRRRPARRSRRRATFLRLLIGRHSTIATVSPSRHAPSSSCAMSFVVRRMNLPYAGCLTSRSTDTVTLFCILLLTTRPDRAALRDFVLCLCCAHVSSSAYFFTRSCCTVFKRAIDLRTLPCWSGFAP